MKCRDCSNKAKENRTMCSDCLKKVSNRTKELNRIALENGLCISCRKRKIHLNNKCEQCILAKKNSDIKLKEKYTLENKCTKCGRSKNFVFVWHHSWCAGCQLKYKFGFIGTKEEAEKIINNLLEKQNFMCALSGRDLRVNKFHIDHILPRTSHPNLISDSNNWQLIVEEANILKSKMSVENLILLCKDIIKHYETKQKI